MTSNPESGPRPDRDETPHHPTIGEEIRHEIEEAVEHVPKPIRWTVGKLVRLAVLAVLALVAVAVATAVLYVINRTEWAAKELALIVNQALAARSDVVLEIGDLKGNPFTGVRVLNPRVRFRHGDAPPLLEAPELRLRYSAWALATGGRGPIVAELVRPQFQLGRKPDGSLRLPAWQAGPAKADGGRVRDFVLVIRDGSLLTPDTTLRIAGLHLDALATIGDGTRVAIRSLSWREGPYGSALERAVAEYSTGDSTRLTVHELRTRDLRFTARAAWQGDARDAVVRADVQRVRWRWLARVFRNGTFDVPGEGRVAVDARGWSSWTGRFAMTAVWDSLPLEARGGLAWDGTRLRLDPLAGTSRAGNLQGAVRWSKQGWEVGGEARDADPAHWQVMGLRGWPAGRLNGRFRYAVDTRAVPHARLAARLAASEWSGWRADSGTVAIDFTPIGPDTFVVRALRRGGEMTLRATTLPTGWRGDYTIARFPLDEWPDGRASGLQGTLASGRGVAEGRSGALLVTGTLEGVRTDWLGIRTARWRLTDLEGALLPKPDLKASARLSDLFFLAVHWDSASVAFRLGDGTIALPGLTAAAGDTVMSLDARADWGQAGWQLTADRAELKSSRFHWTADPPLRLAGDAAGVRFERVAARDSLSRLEIEGLWAAPGGRYDWTARATALDLGRLGLPAEWDLSGSGDAMLRVTGAPGDPRWTFVGAAGRPGARGHRADSLRLNLNGGPGRLEVAEARALLDGGWASAQGEVMALGRAWPDTLTGQGVLRWIGDAGRWRGTLRAERMPLDRLGNLAPAAAGWRGRVTGSLEVRGSPARPDLAWNLDAQPLEWKNYRVDALTARGEYRDGRLEVPELRMTRGGLASTIKGSMPLELALGRRPAMPETPMEWRVDLPGGDLALLPVFVPQIGFASGKLDVDARLTGTMKRPDLSGRVRIRDGRLRMAGREEELVAVTADLTLDEARITLDSLVARQTQRRGTTGTVRADGAIELDGLALRGYHFKIDLHDFTALETGVYAAAFDGQFTVTNGPRVGGATLPLVQGTVELNAADVLFDFANQSEVEQVAAATKPLYWVYRIQLNATDKLHWKPPDANVEFSADLRVEQTRDALIVYGDMSALRGTYFYLNNRFTVERADLTFDNVGGVDPRLDIEAVTRVPSKQLTGLRDREEPSAPGTGSEDGRLEEIVVTITGRSRQPVVSFSASGKYDQPTILQALTYGPLLGGVGATVAGDYADNYFTRALNRQLSADLQRAFQGWVSDVELARESGGIITGEGGVILRVGIPVSRNVSLRYGQAIGGPGNRPAPATTTTNPLERDLEAEYRLNRFFYFTTELVQRRTTNAPSATVTAPEFNVNLKARWEY